MATLAFYRAPSIAEQVLPFAVLFGAMAALLGLSRKLELVVARAAGVSAWQFLQPGLVTGAVIGVVAVTLFNPMAANFKQRAANIEAKIFARSGKATTDKELWLRQKSVDGQSVVRAISASELGRQLNQVTFFNYDSAGRFLERVEARRAVLFDGYWELNDVRVVSTLDEPQTYATSVIATNLEREQVRRSFIPPEQVSYWDFAEVIDRTEKAGLDATRYKLHHAALTSRPLLLVAMISAIALTLRERKDSKYQVPSDQVRVRRGDRVRLVTMATEADARQDRGGGLAETTDAATQVVGQEAKPAAQQVSAGSGAK
jgi:lipopolysaccharide export system permease protein